MPEHVVELLRLAAAPRRHVGQDGVLVQVVLDHVGHVGIDELVVGHAGARRVRQRHVARGPGAHQARHAERGILAEHLRVEEVVVDAPVDHVHARPAAHRLHVDAVVTIYREVAALDQLAAHLPREVGVLEVRRVVDAGREHHDLGPCFLARRRARSACRRAARGSRPPAGWRRSRTARGTRASPPGGSRACTTRPRARAGCPRARTPCRPCRGSGPSRRCAPRCRAAA